MKNVNITDEQWKLFSNSLTRNNKNKTSRPPTIDDRIAFMSIFYVLIT